MTTTPMAVTIRGVHEIADPATTKTTYPSMSSAGPYFLGMVSPANFLAKFKALTAPAFAASLTPLWTWKPNPADVAAGLWDLPIKAVRDYHLANHLASVVYPWHEPEDNMTGATFTALFNRIYPQLSTPPNILVGYTANTYEWRPGVPATANPADWTVAQADWLGADVYSGQSFPATATLLTHAGFQRWWTTLAEGGPFMLPERGFLGDPRPDTIAAECSFLASADTPILGYQIWSAPGSNAVNGWLLDHKASLLVSAVLTCLAGKATAPPVGAMPLVSDPETLPHAE